MEIIEAIILGLVQGLTEFLPVSSSGHIELCKSLLGVEIEEDLLFTVFLHLATTLSVIIVFRKNIWELALGVLGLEKSSLMYLAWIVVSMLPVGLLGVFFKENIETFFFGQVMWVACLLICTGVILFVNNYYIQNIKSYRDLNIFYAFIIGVAQAIAVLPGISRSGSTITTALFLKIDKDKATQFSFLMVIPPIFGAGLLSFKDYMEVETSSSLSMTYLAIASLSAFVSGTWACHAMIGIVRKQKLHFFGVYCIFVGLATVLLNL